LGDVWTFPGMAQAFTSPAESPAEPEALKPVQLRPQHEAVPDGPALAKSYPIRNPRSALPKRSFTFNPQSLIATLSRTEFWLNKVGIVLFLFGVAFLFKYAIDRRWITEEARLG